MSAKLFILFGLIAISSAHEVCEWKCTEYPDPPEPLPPSPESPPPSPLLADQFIKPPAGFPYCKCAHKAPSKMSLSRTTYDNTTNTYCFKLKVASTCVNKTSPCCSMPLEKIEFKVNDQCYGSHAFTTLNNAYKPPSMQKSPGLIRVSQLNLTQAKAKNMKVCITLKEPCTTLRQLCGASVCWYALLDNIGNNSNRCCDVRYV